MWKSPFSTSKTLHIDLIPAQKGLPFFKTDSNEPNEEGEVFKKMWTKIVMINSTDFKKVKLHINFENFILTDKALTNILAFFNNNLNIPSKIKHIHLSHIEKASSLNILNLINILIQTLFPVSIKFSKIYFTQIINTALTIIRENSFITSLTLKNIGSDKVTYEILSQCGHLKEVRFKDYTHPNYFQQLQEQQQKNQTLLDQNYHLMKLLEQSAIQQLEKKNEDSAKTTLETTGVLEASLYDQKKLQN